MPQLRLALAQVNARVGDLEHNADLVVDQCKQAAEQGAHLIVFPEMVLTGYPLEDLAFRSSIIKASKAAAADLAKRLADEGCGDLVAVVGFLDDAEDVKEAVGIPKNAPQNAVAVMHGGEIVAKQAKHHLWNYGVGDEIRTFVPGDTINIVQVRGIDVALAICEDLWRDGPSAAAKAADAALLVVPNGSPYEADKDDVRLDLCVRRARKGECALAYVNLVGGQDELVFDGDSIVVGADGTLLGRTEQFEPELLVVDLDLPAATPAMPDEDERFGGLKIKRTIVTDEPAESYEPRPVEIRERMDRNREIYTAIVVGLRDYVEKNGFRSVLFGASGGIDSTLVGAIAVDALGPDRVFGVSNPSSWSTEHSKTDAAELAERTGFSLDTVPIAPIFDAYQEALHLEDVAEENLQARIRAVIWMGLSNKDGHLVLACGNKSELATGYSTIYGDAVGGYAPIKDVPKTLVWELSRWRNAWAEEHGETPPIPENAISKPPSAELRPGQVDSDSLPPYDLLDAILDAYVERDLGSADVIAEGFDPEVVQQVITLVDRAEYKRRQYPPGPKVSRRNFGRDRRVPITNLWREHL
ncbi:NAD+ synthase [Aeromicrobium terrae]|uniref:Glutamine-dependent NAD(+) synthetase n=1 Tax=Aeromicrobium terrae TaxID=2498846 RepID=A0A5C8NNS6_9ACTN|nr:NAD+ synthase [Aeromicrobium terrae]TXL62747.1 NAD+ synthase [Aeromicrobium terrae]